MAILRLVPFLAAVQARVTVVLAADALVLLSLPTWLTLGSTLA
jgi:hypothetical protein